MSNLTAKCDALREDLRMDLQTLNPPQGSIVIVRPKNSSLTILPHYMAWIREALSQLRPDIQVLVLSENTVEIAVKGNSS